MGNKGSLSTMEIGQVHDEEHAFTQAIKSEASLQELLTIPWAYTDASASLLSGWHASLCFHVYTCSNVAAIAFQPSSAWHALETACLSLLSCLLLGLHAAAWTQ